MPTDAEIRATLVRHAAGRGITAAPDGHHLFETVDRLQNSARIWRLMADQTLRDAIKWRAIGQSWSSGWSDENALRFLTEARDREATARDLIARLDG